MKKLKVFSFAFLVVALSSYGQVQVVSKSIQVPCCQNSDSIDYDSDTKYDFKIFSKHGYDSKSFFVQGLNNVQVAGTKDYGEAFEYYGDYTSLTGTTMGCMLWYSYWLPGSNTKKYVGFRDIISVGDTVYGWVELQFNGQQNSCEDTMVTKTIVYNQTHNAPIFAGLTSTGKSEINASLFKVINKPNEVIMNNQSSFDFSVNIFNLSGQSVLSPIKISASAFLNISTANLPSGIYILSFNDGFQSNYQKIIVE